MVRAIPAIGLVLLAVFEIGTGLHCYECNSWDDSGCNDPFTYQNLTHCDYNANANTNTVAACAKVELKDGYIRRGCIVVPLNEMIKQICYKHRNTRTCIVCDTDGCNGGGSIVASVALAAVAAVAALALVPS